MKVVIGIIIGVCVIIGIVVAVVCMAVGKLQQQGEYLDEYNITTVFRDDKNNIRTKRYRG